MPVNNPTLLTSGGVSTAAPSLTTTSISPSADGLLLFSCIVRNSTQGFPVVLTSTNIVSTFAGAGAWTEIAPHAESTNIGHIFAYSQMGALPGSGAITADFSGSTSRQYAWAVCEISGHSTATPVSESTFGESTRPNIRTIADIASGNLLVQSAGFRTTGSVVPDADFTTLVNASAVAAVWQAIAYDANDDETSGAATFSGATGNEAAITQILAEFAQSTEVAIGFILERVERHYPRGHQRGVLRGALHFGVPNVVLANPQLSV